MSTRVDYSKIIKYVEEYPKDVIEITQKKVKRIANNELARYILENGFEFEIIEPKLIIKKKSA